MEPDAFDVFVSYAHDDQALLKELEKHLALMRREGKIRTWTDREIAAGEEWRGQISQQLEIADLILLLVSASFLASDYCWDIETRRALERHTLGQSRVVPILLRPCDWLTAPIAELQALPADGRPVTSWQDRDDAWLNITRGLRTVIDEIGGSGTAGEQAGPPVVESGSQEPSRTDQETLLNHRLKKLVQLRKERILAGKDPGAIENKIVAVRRVLRWGPQLRKGEFLEVGRYELEEPVGQGGFATVWKAWDHDVEQLVALKVLHGHHSSDRSKRERFFRGARKMYQLTHPHIVRVLEREVEEDGWCFFVMEYVDGGDLEKKVLERRLSPAKCLEVVLQVGEGLSFAHQHGIVHRDVKPSNILLTPDFEAKLTDFDLVRAEDTTGLTATQAMMGTVQFAAPEALESSRQATSASDVYSLGSVAVFAYLGERLPPSYYRNPLSSVAELAVSERVREVLRRAVATEVPDRYSSVAEFCRDLDSATKVPKIRLRRRSASQPADELAMTAQSPRRPQDEAAAKPLRSLFEQEDASRRVEFYLKAGYLVFCLVGMPNSGKTCLLKALSILLQKHGFATSPTSYPRSQIVPWPTPIGAYEYMVELGGGLRFIFIDFGGEVFDRIRTSDWGGIERDVATTLRWIHSATGLMFLLDLDPADFISRSESDQEEDESLPRINKVRKSREQMEFFDDFLLLLRALRHEEGNIGRLMELRAASSNLGEALSSYRHEAAALDIPLIFYFTKADAHRSSPWEIGEGTYVIPGQMSLSPEAFAAQYFPHLFMSVLAQVTCFKFDFVQALEEVRGSRTPQVYWVNPTGSEEPLAIGVLAGFEFLLRNLPRLPRWWPRMRAHHALRLHRLLHRGEWSGTNVNLGGVRLLPSRARRRMPLRIRDLGRDGSSWNPLRLGSSLRTGRVGWTCLVVGLPLASCLSVLAAIGVQGLPLAATVCWGLSAVGWFLDQWVIRPYRMFTSAYYQAEFQHRKREHYKLMKPFTGDQLQRWLAARRADR